MDAVLERLIDVGGAFLILSLVVEKVADFIKLRNTELSVKLVKPSEQGEEKKREGKILSRNIWIGLILALFLKADAVQMLVSGEPGEVVGWENVFFMDEESQELLSASNAEYFSALRFGVGAGKVFYTWIFMVIGIALTGVSLSFGSKFWHDLVGILYEIKEGKAKMAGRR